MRKALVLAALVLSVGLTAALDAEAKRLGGARNSGMQRQQTTQPAAQPNTPSNMPGQAQPAAGAAATAAAPAAAAAAGAKRSWMGPVAGLAAGLGLAALASHLGFGEGLANIMLIALLAFAVMAVVGFVMRKRMAQNGGPAMAGAGAGNAGVQPVTARTALGGTRIGSGLGGMAPAAATAQPIPADFDAAAFSRNAMAQFMALQSANDARDLDRLRDYLTPEMFEEVRAEIAARGDAPQQTEVFGLQAQVLEVVEEADRYIVSVRFSGSVRDQAGAVPDTLDEIWHLTKPRAGFGGWVVAGIQQAV